MLFFACFVISCQNLSGGSSRPLQCSVGGPPLPQERFGGPFGTPLYAAKGAQKTPPHRGDLLVWGLVGVPRCSVVGARAVSWLWILAVSWLSLLQAREQCVQALLR